MSHEVPIAGGSFPLEVPMPHISVVGMISHISIISLWEAQASLAADAEIQVSVGNVGWIKFSWKYGDLMKFNGD